MYYFMIYTYYIYIMYMYQLRGVLILSNLLHTFVVFLSSPSTRAVRAELGLGSVLDACRTVG